MMKRSRNFLVAPHGDPITLAKMCRDPDFLGARDHFMKGIKAFSVRFVRPWTILPFAVWKPTVFAVLLMSSFRFMRSRFLIYATNSKANREVAPHIIFVDVVTLSILR